MRGRKAAASPEGFWGRPSGTLTWKKGKGRKNDPTHYLGRCVECDYDACHDGRPVTRGISLRKRKKKGNSARRRKKGFWHHYYLSHARIPVDKEKRKGMLGKYLNYPQVSIGGKKVGERNSLLCPGEENVFYTIRKKRKKKVYYYSFT